MGGLFLSEDVKQSYWCILQEDLIKVIDCKCIKLLKDITTPKWVQQKIIMNRDIIRNLYQNFHWRILIGIFIIFYEILYYLLHIKLAVYKKCYTHKDDYLKYFGLLFLNYNYRNIKVLHCITTLHELFQETFFTTNLFFISVFR